jgi:hypothetical protein
LNKLARQSGMKDVFAPAAASILIAEYRIARDCRSLLSTHDRLRYFSAL